MRRRIDELARLIKNRRGETLVETVMSLLIFTVVMMAVTYIITTSLKIVGATQNDEAYLRQFDNSFAEADYGGASAVMTFTVRELAASSAHRVIAGSGEGLFALRPDVEDTP